MYLIFSRLTKGDLSIPPAVKDVHSGKNTRIEEHNAERRTIQGLFRARSKYLLE